MQSLTSLHPLTIGQVVNYFLVLGIQVLQFAIPWGFICTATATLAVWRASAVSAAAQPYYLVVIWRGLSIPRNQSPRPGFGRSLERRLNIVRDVTQKSSQLVGQPAFPWGWTGLDLSNIQFGKRLLQFLVLIGQEGVLLAASITFRTFNEVLVAHGANEELRIAVLEEELAVKTTGSFAHKS